MFKNKKFKNKKILTCFFASVLLAACGDGTSDNKKPNSPKKPVKTEYTCGAESGVVSLKQQNVVKACKLADKLYDKNAVKKVSLLSGYGATQESYLGDERVHTGIDFQASPQGVSSIQSLTDGEVCLPSNLAKGSGLVVIKSNVDNQILQLRYAHLKDIQVQQGQQIRAGDILGYEGSVGTNESKLHFGVSTNDISCDKIPDNPTDSSFHSTLDPIEKTYEILNKSSTHVSLLPEIPTSLSPGAVKKGDVVLGDVKNIGLSWNAVNEAAYYTVTLYDLKKGSVIHNKTTTDTFWYVPTLSYNTSYYWSVQACNSVKKCSAESRVFFFDTPKDTSITDKDAPEIVKPDTDKPDDVNKPDIQPDDENTIPLDEKPKLIGSISVDPIAQVNGFRVQAAQTFSGNIRTYELWRSDTASSEGEQVQILLSKDFYGFDDEDVAQQYGKTFYYTVKACNLYGCTASNVQSVTMQKPEKPTFSGKITVSKISNGFEISSQANVSGIVDTVNLYRSTTASNKGKKIQSHTNDSLNFTDTAVKIETTYYYTLAVCNVSGCSFSNTVKSEELMPPKDINKRPFLYDEQVRVERITDGFKLIPNVSSNVSWYKVYRTNTPEEISPLTEAEKNKLFVGSYKYTIKAENVKDNTLYDKSFGKEGTYYYTVSACNYHGCFFSKPIKAKMTKPSLDAYYFSFKQKITSEGTQFTFPPSAYTSRYELWRSAKLSERGSKVTTNTKPVLIDTKAIENTKYYYTIAACNSIGCSYSPQYESLNP